MKKLVCLLLSGCLILSACSSPPKYDNVIKKNVPTSVNTPTPTEEVEIPTEISNEPTITEAIDITEEITPTEEPIKMLTKEEVTSIIKERVFEEAEKTFSNTVKLLDFKVLDTDSKLAQALLKDNELIENGLLRSDIFNDWSEEKLTQLQTLLNDYFGGIKIEDFVNGKPMKLVYYSLLIPNEWGITEGINAGISSYDWSYKTTYSLETIPNEEGNYIHIKDEPIYHYYSLNKDKYLRGCNYLPFSSSTKYLSNVFNKDNHYQVKHGFFITLKDSVELKDIIFSINVAMGGGYYVLPENIEYEDYNIIEDKKVMYIDERYYQTVSCSFADLSTESMDWSNDSNNWIEDIEQSNGKYIKQRSIINIIDNKPVLFTFEYSDLHKGSAGNSEYRIIPQFTIKAFMLDGSKTIGKTIKSINIRLKDENNPSEYIDEVYFDYSNFNTSHVTTCSIDQCKVNLYTLATLLIVKSRPVKVNDQLVPQEENFTNNFMNDIDLYELYVVDSNDNEIVIPISWVLP